MPLPPGTRLGRYEIREILGAGGMGEVYRAVDASLQRDVAIKVLPEEFASDADRLRRFQQEALATATLNHPHVVAVYDVGAHERGAFVVTELLEGRTLRDVLAAGPLPLRKAIDYATQIANGLAAVHEKGIVHRDLKPENVFVTRDERVKILDFGIARVVRGATFADAETADATATMPGSILGTVGYMSPEQVRGEVADHRSDIFAFGVILYEMLTRRRAFQRETAPGTLAAILHDDPPEWTGDGTLASLRMMRLVRRCLEKSPGARFQSARDLMLVLSDEVTDSSLAAVVPQRRSRLAIVGVAGAVFFTALGAWIGPSLHTNTSVASDSALPTTFKLSLPDGATLPGGGTGPPVISHDGQRIAAVLTRDNVNQLHVLNLASDEWQLLPGTDNAREPFFSPDGRQVAFMTGNTLMR